MTSLMETVECDCGKMEIVETSADFIDINMEIYYYFDHDDHVLVIIKNGHRILSRVMRTIKLRYVNDSLHLGFSSVFVREKCGLCDREDRITISLSKMQALATHRRIEFNYIELLFEHKDHFRLLFIDKFASYMSSIYCQQMDDLKFNFSYI